MALEIKQSQRMVQSLVMTPQLQQAIKLLQLSRLELAQAIQTELTENPILEESADDDPPKPDELAASGEREVPDELAPVKQDEQTRTGDEKKAVEDFDWESYFESNSYALPPSAGAWDGGEEGPSFESQLSAKGSLYDHLMWQLSVSELSEEDRMIGARIIGEVDDDGYAPEDITTRVVQEVADEVAEERGAHADGNGNGHAHHFDGGADEARVEGVLRMLQNFDPVGVCARNLKECLTLQAIHLGYSNDVVNSIIDRFLPAVEKRNLPLIARELKLPLEQVITAVKLIEQMDPRPGRHYTAQEAQYITPDIYVYRVGDDFTIVLNEDGLPKLKISHYYKEAMAGARGEAKGYIQDKLRNAVWLIRSIHQRQRTIYRVVESILKFQRPFFEHGVAHLKPLILRQVADDIGMHESTVSRVTSNKYVHTPQGIFELKYFFNSSISSSDGSDDVASEAVKNIIKHLVEKEDSRKPLSDQRLVALIRDQNKIEIARRTVAKYREMMGILSSAKRKRLY